MSDRILLSGPDMDDSDREALLRAFDGGWIAPVGPELTAFEDELAAYVGVEACVALASGTAGLHLGLLECGVEPGDEVVVQSATFAAQCVLGGARRGRTGLLRHLARHLVARPRPLARLAEGEGRSGPPAQSGDAGRPLRQLRRLPGHRSGVRRI